VDVCCRVVVDEIDRWGAAVFLQHYLAKAEHNWRMTLSGELVVFRSRERRDVGASTEGADLCGILKPAKSMVYTQHLPNNVAGILHTFEDIYGDSSRS
jgi:hypothetical protein